MKPMLTANALAIGYADKTIASGINFEIDGGSLVSVVGANGIGKSTLLRTLCGIQDPLSGAVSVNQKSVIDYTVLQLAREISLVLTEKPASTHLTVHELVSLGRLPHTNWMGAMTGRDREITSSALEQTGTAEFANRRIAELSDGQLQKVMLARAVAQDTPLIVLDEPSTHLDMLHKLTLFRLLRKLANEGKCVLFSTHDIEQAIAISDMMIVMNGESVVTGTPSKLIADGVFSTLFPESEIAFDPQAVKFVFKGL